MTLNVFPSIYLPKCRPGNITTLFKKSLSPLSLSSSASGTKSAAPELLLAFPALPWLVPGSDLTILLRSLWLPHTSPLLLILFPLPGLFLPSNAYNALLSYLLGGCLFIFKAQPLEKSPLVFHEVIYFFSWASRYLMSLSITAPNTRGWNALFTSLPPHSRLGIPKGQSLLSLGPGME